MSKLLLELRLGNTPLPPHNLICCPSISTISSLLRRILEYEKHNKQNQNFCLINLEASPGSIDCHFRCQHYMVRKR